jgi:hypothetical protein
MMRVLAISLVVIFLAGTGIGQIGKDALERERREQQLQKEHEKRVTEVNERLAELRNPAPRFVDKFVGFTGNSWAVSLVSEGGLFGFRTIAAMNSDKKAYCGFDNDSMIVADIPDELFFKLQSFVDKPLHIGSADSNRIPACKDCSTESIVISFRSGSDIRSQTFRVSDSSSVVSRLYEAMYGFKGCQNSTPH